MSLCIAKVLEQKDRELAVAIQQVATDASNAVGGQFSRIWKDSLNDLYKTSADPEDQLLLFNRLAAMPVSIGTPCRFRERVLASS